MNPPIKNLPIKKLPPDPPKRMTPEVLPEDTVEITIQKYKGSTAGYVVIKKVEVPAELTYIKLKVRELLPEVNQPDLSLMIDGVLRSQFNSIELIRQQIAIWKEKYPEGSKGWRRILKWNRLLESVALF